MRKERISGSVMMLAEPMDVSHPVCRRQNCPARAAEEGWNVGVRERLMSSIGPAYTTGRAATLSEISCGECGALLDAQVTMQGTKPLFDGRIPGGRRT